ncbi:Ribonuclease H [Citrus sinensis]|nr:Ribonuclease H [Citrus sinensis]
MCQEFTEQFREAMAPEDNMMKLTSIKQREEETLREFIKRFHRAVLDLGAFNHPQALRGLKEGVKIGRLWYNLRNLAIQTYSAAYEQAKRDIEIEEEKAAQIKTDQLEGLKSKEKRAVPGNEPIKRRDHHKSSSGTGGRIAAYQPHQRPPQYQRSRAQPPCSLARKSWRRHDTAYGHLHPHPHGSRGSRPEVLPPPPTQNGTNRERAVHMIDQNQDYGRYTSLKMPLDEVYKAIKDRGLLYLPAPITKLPGRRDMGRYCKFHGTHGHTTTEYRDLKTQDALVIQATVASKKFDRILVDTGSSVDVLFKSTLEEMRIADLSKGSNAVGAKNGRQEPVEELETVSLGPEEPGKTIRIRSRLNEEQKQELVQCLRAYADVFAWTHEDMSGIDPEVACHKLAIKKGAQAVRQKKRCFNQERYDAINDEVEKLLKVGFIREVNYPEWISNVVLVKKANGKYRMCVDFTDLNKPCPKDSFSLPKIDQLVDSTPGYGLLSFMDAFSGYNQIPMFEHDEESTTFITNQGLFCYRVMPFGLKNTGATYQRLVNRIFKLLIGRTMEVYVDDMITKSKIPKEHVEHLEETFRLLRKYKMKLNPEKCAFGVESGKFLGFMVSHRGIEVNPEKIQAIVQMRSPRNLKEMQSLLGRLATLSRFISKAADNYRATSSVLVREEEGVQYPIYYTSKALLDAETRYSPLEKWALALVLLRQTLHKPDASGRLVKWAIELSEFDIDYKPRAAIKAQAMADFVAEFAEPEVCLDQPDIAKDNSEARVWQMSVDGSLGEQGSGVGIVLEGPEGEKISYAVKLEFTATNNQAEYEALIAGLELAKAVKADKVKIRIDPQLVANHVSERFQPRDEKMEQYLKKVRQMMRKFEAVEVIQIPKEQNSRADILVRMAALADPKMPKLVPLEVKTNLSIEQSLEVMQIEQKGSWMDPIVLYIRDGVLPPDKLRARKIRAQASRYTMIDGVLYRRGYTLPFLRCLDEDDADYVLREVHKGICENHSGGRSLAHKPFAQWGIDLIGPLPRGRGAATHAIIAIDYFTNWIEVEALSRITEKKTTDFVWRNLVCRYGIPYALVTDNGRQFDNHSFRDFCQNLGIELKYCSPAHPQSNGQVEAANKTIKRLLKTRLGAKKSAWVDELSGVLRAYRATHKIATGETPFALAYGHEAVVPAEIGTTTHRTDYFNEQENNEQMGLNLDLLTEKREQASKRSAIYQQRVVQYYNQKVIVRQFRVGDWVLRRVNQNTKNSTQGVLGPNWEGPYRVKQIVGLGAYKLIRADGHESQNLFMVRPEAKRARICSTKRRRVESQTLKKFPRHAKAHQVSKPVYGETRSQACQDLLDQAKASRIPNIENVSKACKGSSSLKACFMARPEAKRARICSTKRRRAESQTLKKFPRHAKAHQVSKPIYGETRSHACQDLLDQAKASRIPNIEKVSKACKGSSSPKACFMTRPEAKRAWICSTKRR